MTSFQKQTGKLSSVLLETSCGFLLQELQMIWDEVGEDQFEREKVLIDLEQECIHVYRRKVDAASISRARLHQELAEAEAEFTHLLLSLGERSLPGRPEKMGGTLREQLDSITPALREMRTRKEERVNKFRAVQGEIRKISAEIAGQFDDTSSVILVNENDISLKKLEEYEIELQRLQNEKNERLRRLEKYIGTIHDLSAILGKDSSELMTLVHPSLNELGGSPKNISDIVLEKLGITVESLLEEKQKRLEKLHSLGKSLINLWNLMDSPNEDRQLFSHVTGLLSLSTEEVSDPGRLTLDIIEQAEAEVKRLDQLKASKMKEVFQKKQIELEKICRDSHMVIPSRAEMEKIINLINSGEIDHTDLLVSMDEQIRRAKEEASSRKSIMEKVEKWMSARNEELWLEEYSRDENRYSVSRGAHKNLRRAERGRIMVSKISALVDSLIARTKGWEEERKKVFYYDEVPLLAMLEEYNMFRQIKEGEKQMQRERKKIQSLGSIDQENTCGSRPGTSTRRIPNRSLNGSLSNQAAQRKISLAIHQMESNSINSAIPSVIYKKEARNSASKSTVPRPSHLALRDETASVVSTFSGPISP